VPPVAERTRLARADESQIGLVNQARGVERLPWLFPGQLLGGQPAQFVIHQRQQFVRRLRISLFNGQKQRGGVGHAGRSW
jgi:hypothetical protein